MPKKIRYRATDVHQICVESLLNVFEEGSTVTVGVDVAKRKFLAALCDGQGQAKQIVCFEHPRQTPSFVDVLKRLRAAGRHVQTVMEPTGTYGDCLRFQLYAHDLPVFRVNNKHVHDAAEVFDGSASKHDAKDACVIGWLHGQQRSEPWQQLPQQRRMIRALIAQRELFDVPLRRLLTQMEPLLARHFPELEKLFNMGRRKTPYRILEKFGSPAALAELDADELTELIHKAARRRPDPATVGQLMQAARNTLGVPPVADEAELISLMSSEILRLMQQRELIDKRIHSAVADVPCVRAMRPRLGAVTAAVVYAYLGDPCDYAGADALEKAAGLNLIESSSGEGSERSPRRLSKRGPGIVRKYLFLTAMRLIKNDPTVAAWYQARRSFQAGNKAKALIAVERKLCRALVHIAAGNDFQASKLFDVRRLKLNPNAEANTETNTEAA